MWSWRCPQPPKEKRKPKTPTKPERTASFLTFCNPSNCSVCLVWFGSPCVRVCVDKVNLSNESRPLHCYKGISMWISCQELAKARLVLVSPPNVPTFRATLARRRTYVRRVERKARNRHLSARGATARRLSGKPARNNADRALLNHRMWIMTMRPPGTAVRESESMCV